MNTYNDCKNIIARKYYYKTFDEVPLDTGKSGVHITDMYDKAAELYVKQFKATREDLIMIKTGEIILKDLIKTSRGDKKKKLKILSNIYNQMSKMLGQKKL